MREEGPNHVNSKGTKQLMRVVPLDKEKSSHTKRSILSQKMRESISQKCKLLGSQNRRHEKKIFLTATGKEYGLKQHNGSKKLLFPQKKEVQLASQWAI